MQCYFVSDLHGNIDRYQSLFDLLAKEPPDILFIGGDILSHGYTASSHKGDFILDYLRSNFLKLKEVLGNDYPQVYIILGNDDPRINEEKIRNVEKEAGVWHYAHNNILTYHDYTIIGYAFVPPTPFGLKDWEKYDVSRYVDPGCSHPFQGNRTVEPDYDPEYDNIKNDLERYAQQINLSRSIFLFHSPPYQTALDRAALDGQMVEYVPLDVHVGSIAIQRFINDYQPMLTLHGHIHEASSITGKWSEKMGNTYAFNAAYDKDALAVVVFDTENLEEAYRKLIG